MNTTIFQEKVAVFSKKWPYSGRIPKKVAVFAKIWPYLSKNGRILRRNKLSQDSFFDFGDKNCDEFIYHQNRFFLIW